MSETESHLPPSRACSDATHIGDWGGQKGFVTDKETKGGFVGMVAVCSLYAIKSHNIMAFNL